MKFLKVKTKCFKKSINFFLINSSIRFYNVAIRSNLKILCIL